MTRFWITLEQAVEFVTESLGAMRGGETFVPKIPSMRVTDIADAIAPGAERKVVGIRPGEKLHEVLLTEDESRHSIDIGHAFVVEPEYASWGIEPMQGEPLADGFRYSSDTNTEWLDVDVLREMAAAVKVPV
jgi:UDP-N-acetylglucosamine 4,6-dehydratase